MAEEYKFGSNSEKLVEEIKLEFKEKMENYAGNMLIENKLFKIGNILDFYFENTCENFVNKLRFCKKAGNDLEMENAVRQLQTCKKPFDDIMTEHKNIQDVFYKIFQNQNMNCFRECHGKYGEKDEIKPCLKDCLNYFDKYTLTAFGEMYSNYLDDVQENLMKAI